MNMETLNNKWLSTLKNYGTLKTYPSKTVIYQTDDLASSIYVVIKGRIRVYAITQDGEEINYEVLSKGSLFGETCLLQNNKRPVNACTITETVLLQISKNNLEKILLSYPEFDILFIKMISESHTRLCNEIRTRKEYNRYQKVVYFLLDTTKEEIADKEILNGVLPYTHQEIAYCTGLNRVTVSKVLSHLEKQGYIRMKYKHVQVLDRKALEKEYNIK